MGVQVQVMQQKQTQFLMDKMSLLFYHRQCIGNIFPWRFPATGIGSRTSRAEAMAMETLIDAQEDREDAEAPFHEPGVEVRREPSREVH